MRKAEPAGVKVPPTATADLPLKLATPTPIAPSLPFCGSGIIAKAEPAAIPLDILSFKAAMLALVDANDAAVLALSALRLEFVAVTLLATAATLALITASAAAALAATVLT